MVEVNRRNLFGLTLAAGGLLALPAKAQAYPSKPIRMVVPFAAGGAVYVLARQCAQKLSELLGQQVVVDARGGAGGRIAAEAAARAAPDGYTLFFANTALTISASINSKESPDPIKDFEPIIRIGTASFMVAVSTGVPVKTLGELITLAKEKPGQLNYASSGPGSVSHVTAELFKNLTGVDIVHVPYTGAHHAMNDLFNNRVQITCLPLETLKPHIGAGKVRVLAIAGPERIASLPDVPTAAEVGLPDFVSQTWYALLAPARTPQPIVAQLSAAVTQLLAKGEFQSTLAASAIVPLGGTPQELRDHLVSEMKKWGDVVRKAGLRID